MFTKDQRRAVRVCALVGVCCALLLGAAGYAWKVHSLAGHLADGDPARGTYIPDPGLADNAGFAVLDGLAGDAGEARPADPASHPAADPAPTEVPPPGDGKAPAEDAPPVHWRSAGWQPSDPLEGRPTAAEPTIGALFSPGEDGDPYHHCSASVVHSPGGDLVATAAHCVHQFGFRTNLVFVPAYRDGEAPYGVWVPSRIDVDPRWASERDPDHDVAFLRLRSPGHPDRRLEDVTGAETIGFRPELPAPARLVGYPNDTEQPLDCRNTARAAGPTQLRLDCADVPDGTSGGPVLTDAHTLIGVIGGRDGGGDDETSYSSYFDDSVRALYERSTGAP
ncbi:MULTISPECIES: serine protease [unclassified Streptomyces]|uniref:trypsin-like serine peptidase n=1 Tax=unclassified Streptomyces TaxID=2593676 RepID=UPI002034E903|nr:MULTISPECIES: trypsin-like peptidase domain-containing protein [unclassified Streptomyces]